MRQYVFRVHALQKMFERGISQEDVIAVIQNGESIRLYEDDKPFPSRLILGWRDLRPLHVVAADNPSENIVIVITAYEPDRFTWAADFKSRKG